EAFVAHRCAACHSTGAEQVELPALAALSELKLDAERSCLAVNAAATTPKFDLTDEQRAALQQTLAAEQADVAPLPPAAQLQHAMKSMNCYACHVRGDLGGPQENRDYFGYARLVDLGDEG